MMTHMIPSKIAHQLVVNWNSKTLNSLQVIETRLKIVLFGIKIVIYMRAQYTYTKKQLKTEIVLNNKPPTSSIKDCVYL